MSDFHEKRKRRLSSGWGLKLGQHQSPSRRKSVAPAIMEQAGFDENDDQAERSQLRKEKKEKERRRKTMAREEVKRPGRKVFAELDANEPSAGQGESDPRTGVKASSKASTKAEIVRLDDGQLSQLYSECIKLATANKINQKNTWELNLIDHMDRVLDSHIDLTGEDAQEKKGRKQSRGGKAADRHLNFQHASCTLDASVKIYSYRVDSVHKDTFKVLGGLTRSDRSKDEADDEDGKKQKKNRERRARATATLESNPDNLNVKTFDLEFEVDPLFRKTHASFDEGGAKGMLMANLSVHGGHHLVFDSTDSVGGHTKPVVAEKKTEEGEEGDGEEGEEENKEPSPPAAVDVSKLASMLQKFGPLSQYSICPLLDDMREYAKAIVSDSKDGSGSGSSADLDHPPASADYNVDVPEYLDDSDDDDGTFVSGNVNLEEAMQREEEMFRELQSEAGVNSEQDVELKQFQASTDLRTAPLPLAAEASEFSYLDTAKFQNWAGPAHWKFPKRANKKEEQQEGKDSTQKKRTRKAAFAVDFFGVAEGKRVPEATFKPPPRSNSTLTAATLAKQTVTKDSEDKNLLPQDIHFKPQRLQSLFHRPSLLLKLRHPHTSTAVKAGQSHVDHADNLVCSAAADAPWTDHDGFVPPDVMYDDGDDSDDGGAPRLDLYAEAAEAMEPDAEAAFAPGFDLVAQPKTVEKIDIHYAKFAKKVDVRALKDNIWGIVEPGMEASVPTGADEAKDTSETPSFQQVVGEIGAAASKTSALNNVSVPFCFICLLHLANEKELELEPAGDPQEMSDFRIVTSQ